MNARATKMFGLCGLLVSTEIAFFLWSCRTAEAGGRYTRLEATFVFFRPPTHSNTSARLFFPVCLWCSSIRNAFFCASLFLASSCELSFFYLSSIFSERKHKPVTADRSVSVPTRARCEKGKNPRSCCPQSVCGNAAALAPSERRRVVWPMVPRR